jgi:hypothetical protein
MRNKLFNLLIAALLIAFVVTAAFPMQAFAATGGVTDANALQELAKLRQATVRYQDVNNALADGFVPVSECVLNQDGTAGMGIHYANFDRLIDPSINAMEPELLLYVPRADGLKLVAVEYMFAIGPPDAPIPASPPAAPVLFGHSFDGPMLGHGPGMPPHYDFHVWLWEANPDGIFTDFNPNVKCP